MGFCNWLRVSQERLDIILAQERDITADDWDSGDIPFFPEMIAPFGHLKKIITEIRANAMAGVPWAYSLRGVSMNSDGTVPVQKIFKWKCGRPGADGNLAPDVPVPPIRAI